MAEPLANFVLFLQGNDLFDLSFKPNKAGMWMLKTNSNADMKVPKQLLTSLFWNGSHAIPLQMVLHKHKHLRNQIRHLLDILDKIDSLVISI